MIKPLLKIQLLSLLLIFNSCLNDRTEEVLINNTLKFISEKEKTIERDLQELIKESHIDVNRARPYLLIAEKIKSDFGNHYLDAKKITNNTDSLQKVLDTAKSILPLYFGDSRLWLPAAKNEFEITKENNLTGTSFSVKKALALLELTDLKLKGIEKCWRAVKGSNCWPLKKFIITEKENPFNDNPKTLLLNFIEESDAEKYVYKSILVDSTFLNGVYTYIPTETIRPEFARLSVHTNYLGVYKIKGRIQFSENNKSFESPFEYSFVRNEVIDVFPEADEKY